MWRFSCSPVKALRGIFPFLSVFFFFFLFFSFFFFLPFPFLFSNVDVRYKSEYLFATVKTARRPIIDGPTFHKLRPDQCNWWLEGDKLFLELEKAIEGLEWDEVITKPNVRSNKIDHEERKRKEREVKELERRRVAEEERVKKGAPTVAEALVNAMGPASYPPREKHRPYKDNKEDEFLFQVD